MATEKKLEMELNGKTFAFETGWMAKQANGSAVVRYGDCMVLAAAVCGDVKQGFGSDDDFLPLTVDYREKPSAAGKFPGGFFKREGRPTTKEILTCRLIDRPVRPLFPEGFKNEIQVQIVVFSADQENDTDILALNAASAALTISDIPFAGPIGAVRIGLIGEEFVVNPTVQQLTESRLELVVAGTKQSIVMVEGGAKELPEEKILEALELAQRHIAEIVEMQLKLKEACGKPVMAYTTKPFPKELYEKVKKNYLGKLKEVFFTEGKKARSSAIKAVRKEAIATLCPHDEQGEIVEGDPTEGDVKKCFAAMENEAVRAYALEGKRADGRGLKDIRPIDIRVGLLPRSHGSVLFTRGETQAIVTVTLGTKDDEQIIDGLMEEYKKRFMLHYNFPSYSVGEIKPIRGPGRREIGHGNLAERAIEAVLPTEEAFPYTLRVVSDILESNGSSSMATVCGATLSLLDAGVGIKAPVAGVAMGLVIEEKKVAVLSDILGSEDKHGDMDFKVAGTGEGITALQMDIKIEGLSIATMRDALSQAKEGRLHILDKMAQALVTPRTEMSPYAPKLVSMTIPPDKIGAVIGPGGKIVREIQEKTKCKVEIDDDGTVCISSSDADALKVAEDWIRSITEGVQVGKTYKAKVVTVKEFGAFVQVTPGGQEGLVHISELKDGFVERVEDVVKLGQMVEIKVVAIDDMGRHRFSIKAVERERAGLPPAPIQAAPSRPPSGGPRHGPGGGGQRFRRFDEARERQS